MDFDKLLLDKFKKLEIPPLLTTPPVKHKINRFTNLLIFTYSPVVSYKLFFIIHIIIVEIDDLAFV
jgi:hypothetical protein